MSVTIFVTNIYETGTVTATSEATPRARLFDRDAQAPWIATTNAQQDLVVDQGASPKAFSHVALMGYLIDTNVEIASGPSSPSTLRATITPTADDPRLVALGGSFSDRHVRARILTGGSVPELAELMIGTPYVISENPHVESERITAGNVHRVRTAGGRMISARLGPEILRSRFRWNALLDADAVILEAAFAESQQGTKALLVHYPDSPGAFGVPRWSVWVDPELTLRPIGLSQSETEITLESAA